MVESYTPSEASLFKRIRIKCKDAARSWLQWFDSEPLPAQAAKDPHEIDWLRVIPFVLMHVGCLAIFWVGYSGVAIGMAIFLYLIRMFAITGFYHRYFSHRTFKTTRVLQFIFAVIGAASIQRGPLWWAAHHRNHHAHSDTPKDTHSPRHQGFLKSHMLWFLTHEHFRTRHNLIKDWQRFPELMFLDRFDTLVPLLLGTFLYWVGATVEHYRPDLGTNGPQMLTWGFFVSTVVLYHATFSVNSIAHIWGTRRYDTSDDSRNNLLMAILTLGEGWHNNHHHYPGSVRQGFFWWEIDPTYWALKIMSYAHLVWDLRPVPLKWRDGKIPVAKTPHNEEQSRIPSIMFKEGGDAHAP